MKEVDQFRSAFYFLKTCMTVCRIELREENNSVVDQEKNIHVVVVRMQLKNTIEGIEECK